MQDHVSFVLQTNFFTTNNNNSINVIQHNLTSPLFTISKNNVSYCFTFDYYFMIDSVQSLSISLIDTIRNNNETKIWSVTNNNIDQWSKAEVPLEQKGSFKVFY